MEIHIAKNTNMIECFKTKSNWWWYYIDNFDILKFQLVHFTTKNIPFSLCDFIITQKESKKYDINNFS